MSDLGTFPNVVLVAKKEKTMVPLTSEKDDMKEAQENRDSVHHYRAGSSAIRKVLSPTHILDVTTESGFFARDVLNNLQASTVETEGGASPPNCLHASDAFQTAGFFAGADRVVSSPASGFETTTQDKTPLIDGEKQPHLHHEPSLKPGQNQLDDPDVLHW